MVLDGREIPIPPIPTGPHCLKTETGARSCAEDVSFPLTDDPGKVACLGCKPIAKALLRERYRRAADAIFRDDARCFPAFADARRAAMLAFWETKPEIDAGDVKSLPANLDILRGYEDDREARRAKPPGRCWDVVAVYERARSGKPRLLGRSEREKRRETVYTFQVKGRG